MRRGHGRPQLPPRHARLRYPVDTTEFAALPSVSDAVSQDGQITFKAAGDLDPIIKAAARHRVRDMQIAHPTLEEVFLTYYAEPGEQQ